MQQFDENNIKKAIENWEETPSGIGFDKAKLLGRLELKKEPSAAKLFMRIAAILIILLLSGSLYYSLSKQGQLNKNNESLRLARVADELRISRLSDSIERLSTSSKIEYITVVKEVPQKSDQIVIKSNSDSSLNQLQLENMALKQSLKTLSLATNHLNDSISQLINNMALIEEEYQIVLNNFQKKKPFEINYNQELIASNSEKPSTGTVKSAEEKLKVKFGQAASQTAPVRRNFSFR